MPIPKSVLDLFEYAPSEPSGLLWKHGLEAKAGVRARSSTVGGKDKQGYRVVETNNKKYKAHRVVWELVNGPIPEGMCIDHIDGNVGRNTIENLRLVTKSDNSKNKRKYSSNRSGATGVYCRSNGTFMASWNDNGRRTKTFSTFAEAAEHRARMLTVLKCERHHPYSERHGY